MRYRPKARLAVVTVPPRDIRTPPMPVSPGMVWRHPRVMVGELWKTNEGPAGSVSRRHYPATAARVRKADSVYFFRWAKALAAAFFEVLLVRPSRKTLLAALPAALPVAMVITSSPWA